LSEGASIADEGQGEAPIVFVSDPSAEAERVARALRSGGYTVIDVPLSMLVARVAVQHPRVVLVDADSHGALDIVARMRELPQADDVHVVFITAPGGAISSLEEALAHEGSGLSLRPIDVEALVRQIDALSGGVLTRTPGTASGGSPASEPSLPPSPPSLPPLGGRGFPAAPGIPETVSFSEPPIPASRIPVPKALSLAPPMSGELQQLLSDAEHRVHVSADDAALPSPEQEIEAVLPADLLAALDEPLEDEEEPEVGVARAGTLGPGASRERTTDGGTSRTTGASTGGGSTPSTPAGRRLTEDGLTPPPSQGPGDAGGLVARHQGMPRPSEGPPPPSASVEPLASRPGSDPALPRASPRPPPPRIEMTGEWVRIVGRAISERTSGSLCFARAIGERRLVLREGDVVTCASTAEDESLIAFLGVRGDLPRETVRRLGSRFPPFGRHAGAALVARGYLLQDQMWPTLRAHAEWILGRILQPRDEGPGVATQESQPPGRLATEPSVFGGAPGAEAFVEGVRRVISPADALERLGGPSVRLGPGPFSALLDECALAPPDLEAVQRAPGRLLREVLEGSPDAELASALFALTQLGVLEVLSSAAGVSSDEPDPGTDAAAIDAEAIRERVRARLQLVEDGDYFAVLGVPRDATGYEVKRAFLELRRSFEPSRLLSPDLADLVEDVRKIASVIDEAYEILRDGPRRERYRRAIEGIAPG
jgi:hypothetical protein